jgi:hypothetical protein
MFWVTGSSTLAEFNGSEDCGDGTFYNSCIPTRLCTAILGQVGRRCPLAVDVVMPRKPQDAVAAQDVWAVATPTFDGPNACREADEDLVCTAVHCRDWLLRGRAAGPPVQLPYARGLQGVLGSGLGTMRSSSDFRRHAESACTTLRRPETLTGSGTLHFSRPGPRACLDLCKSRNGRPAPPPPVRSVPRPLLSLLNALANATEILPSDLFTDCFSALDASHTAALPTLSSTVPTVWHPCGTVPEDTLDVAPQARSISEQRK